MSTRVLLDSTAIPRDRGGVGRYIDGLLEALSDEHAGVAVIAHPVDAAAFAARGIEVIPAPWWIDRAPLRLVWEQMVLPGVVRRGRFDVLHSPHYTFPLRGRFGRVVTIHDLSFEHGSAHMALKDRLVFRRVVPRAARAARRVLTVSERTRADLIRLYGLPEEKVVVTPNGVDPAFTPGNNLMLGTYVLAVGAVQPRKNQLRALAAAEEAMLPLVVAGPVKDEALGATLRERGADLRGYVSQEELADLYHGAACLVQASRFEGFGLPVLEAMASGTPVVALDEPALREVAGDAAVFVDEEHLADGVRRALAERDQLVAAGLERARLFTWRATAELTLDVYREALG